MPPHTTTPARAAPLIGAAAVHRSKAALARACLAVGVLAAAAAGTVLAGAGPAAAAPAVLYAAPAAAGTGDCSTAANACPLTTALTNVQPGGTIELVTPGGDTAASRYVGNWSVTTPGTTASAPVTIAAAPGLASQPVLDGDGPSAPSGETCSTTACNGPVLTVPANEFVALTGITIANANNTSTAPTGGGLDNAGTVTITGCTFTNDDAFTGGAIATGDGFGLGGTGSVTVTGSTFTGNDAATGGAIASGAGAGGGGSVTVTGSTFTGNAAFSGGAISSGDSGGGTVTVTASTFTGNTALNGGAIDSGENGAGTVTVTASTFTGNTAGSGGAIDSGETGAGTVQVVASTFSGNSTTAGGQGGAIASGDYGAGTVQVTASTFSGNTASFGGAIDSGSPGCANGCNGGGTVQVTASTFSGNTASIEGGTIDSGTNWGGVTSSGSVLQVAGDVFDGSCVHILGTWTDGGYNAGSDGSCFNGGTGDVNAGSAAALNLGPLGTNGGPTQTILPGPGSKAIGIIPDPTSLTLGGSFMFLCGAVDQRGYASTGSTCDAGAVQTAASPPGLTVTTSATPATFNAAGQVITYHYLVTDTGTGLGLHGITVTDPAVPGISCPSGVLPGGSSETCTGSYTTTAADLAAGKITDTATATGATINGVPGTSNTATVTVPGAWPPAVTGLHRPAAHAAEGYYLGVKGSTWQLLVTHPGTGNVTFTGTITINAGNFRNLAGVNLGTGDSAGVTRKTLTFQFTDNGAVKGIRFATTAADTSITFTLNIAGHPATTSQLFLGGTPTNPASGSPLTYTR